MYSLNSQMVLRNRSKDDVKGASVSDTEGHGKGNIAGFQLQDKIQRSQNKHKY